MASLHRIVRGVSSSSSSRAFFTRTTVAQLARSSPITTSPFAAFRRTYATEEGSAPVEAPDYLNEAELKIFNILKKELQPTKLDVQDISGGCGSMYALDVVSAQFSGLPVIKQHRIVNKVLGEEIKKWHGVQLKTKAP